MLKAIIGLNIFQLLYFNLSELSVNKVVASTVFSLVLSTIFFYALGQLIDFAHNKAEGPDGYSQSTLCHRSTCRRASVARALGLVTVATSRFRFTKAPPTD
jgi:hypothetical protein